MMRWIVTQKRVVIASSILALVLVSGCLGRSPNVRLFSMADSELLPEADRAPGLAVMIGPVRTPAYLTRPQIARRAGGGEVVLDEWNRWIGGFESNLIRGVERNVRRQLGSERVVGYPSKAPFPIDYRVRIHVDEFVVDDSNRLVFDVRWAIVRGARTGTGRSGTSVDSAELSSLRGELPLTGTSVEALVRAHDEAIAQLAMAIADQLVATAAAP